MGRPFSNKVGFSITWSSNNIFVAVSSLKPNVSEFKECKKGIWIQIKKDDEFRGDGIGDCLEGGSKKKDCFYLLLPGIGTFDDAAEQEAQAGFQTGASTRHRGPRRLRPYSIS